MGGYYGLFLWVGAGLLWSVLLQGGGGGGGLGLGLGLLWVVTFEWLFIMRNKLGRAGYYGMSFLGVGLGLGLRLLWVRVRVGVGVRVRVRIIMGCHFCGGVYYVQTLRTGGYYGLFL